MAFEPALSLHSADRRRGSLDTATGLPVGPSVKRHRKLNHLRHRKLNHPWAARGTWAADRLPQNSLETPNHMDHPAPELAVGLVERQGREGRMGGLQPEDSLAPAQALDREAIAQPGDDDGAIAWLGIPFHHQEITATDASAAHGIAAHGQQQAALRATDQQAMQVDGPKAVRTYYSVSRVAPSGHDFRALLQGRPSGCGLAPAGFSVVGQRAKR